MKTYWTMTLIALATGNAAADTGTGELADWIAAQQQAAQQRALTVIERHQQQALDELLADRLLADRNRGPCRPVAQLANCGIPDGDRISVSGCPVDGSAVRRDTEQPSVQADVGRCIGADPALAGDMQATGRRIAIDFTLHVD